MIKIALIGHDYRYEAYTIASLFYEKKDILFVDSESEGDIVSIYNEETNSCISKVNHETEFKVNVEDNKKQIKLGIKSTLLSGLKHITGKEVPWGILVGIRPTKLYHDFKEEGLGDDMIREILSSKYHLYSDKIDLLIKVAKAEEPFLQRPNRAVGIYIGIPFCPTRCSYCSFTSNPLGTKGKMVDAYLDCLIKEIEYTSKLIKEKNINVDTLYIGGGTPTALNEGQLERLLETVSKNINTDNIREYTIEAGRPDSITREKLNIIKKYKADRISVNPQTMNDETLRKIGRIHTSEDTINIFNMAREIGFNNINMDMIIGLPGEGVDHVKRTIESIKQLHPESITIHTMAIKRASKLNEQGYECNNDESIQMYNLGVNGAKDIGMIPYYMYRQKNMVSPLENVGYSLKGMECIYNVQMIAENISIIGLGADSVSKAIYPSENRLERVGNLKDLHEYINRIDEVLLNKKKVVNMIDESFS
ncbi:MAG: coproporphyrinogen dehydrogenase HemZ [Clostridium sp.]